jgi:hypothetical protein
MKRQGTRALLAAAKRAYFEAACVDCNTSPSPVRSEFALRLCDDCFRRRRRAHVRDQAPAPATREDPFSGVISERALLFSVGSKGHKHGPGRSWEWNPTGRTPQVFVHRDGYTTAHTGLGDVQEQPEERLIRGARLDPSEAEIVRRQARGERRKIIMVALGFTSLRKYERSVSTINEKMAALAAALREMARGGG